MSAESAALRALERRIRAQVTTQLDAVTATLGAKLASLVRGGDRTGGELVSREELAGTLTASLERARSRVEVVTRTGYLSATRLARIVTAKQLAEVGHRVPSKLPDLGDYLDAVLADVRAAFDGARFDLQDGIRAAYDGVTGDNAQAARVLTTNAALKRVVRRLAVSANAAGVAALHRGFSDAQLALYSNYQDINPFVTLRKRWLVTASDPCPACAALHGTTVPLDAEFDHDAGWDISYSPPRVYRDLHGPPRHPNCRCRIELVFASDPP